MQFPLRDCIFLELRRNTMKEINEINDVFCDALAEDDGYLVFASCWGRDTAIQELLARLSLPSSEGGIKQLTVDNNQVSEKTLRQVIKIGNPDRLDKMTGRMPKSNLFGDLVHLWLFDKKVRIPDYVNRQAYLLFQPDQQSQVNQTWSLIKQVSHLPLLDDWQEAILNLMRENRWLKVLEGYEMNLLCISLPEHEFDQAIHQMIHQEDIKVFNEVV